MNELTWGPGKGGGGNVPELQRWEVLLGAPRGRLPEF